MLSVNVQDWDKRAKVIIDVFLASFLARCPSWHLSKESETPFFFSFFSIFSPNRCLAGGGGGNVEVNRHSLLRSIMLSVLQKGLILRCTFSSLFFSQKQPKGKSSNNVIPVWAPNRHGPFKTEQQNWSQRIKLLLPLLKHKLHIQWNDRVQLSAILRTFVLWSSENVRHVDSFFRHTVRTRNSKVDTAQYVIMFQFQRSVGSGVHPCGLRVTRGVFLNRDCYGLGFRCDGVEC